jgi:hypothetical protein
MNVEQKRKILTAIQTLEKDIDELKRCRAELALNGYASATLSSSGGSRSYTRLDVTKISLVISQLQKELQEYRDMLSNGGNMGLKLRSILHIYG